MLHLVYHAQINTSFIVMIVYKPLKKVRKLKFHRSYFSYYHTSNMVIDIIRKPVYLSLNSYHICNGYEIMESTLILQSIVYWLLKTHWRMKTIGVSLLRNTNE